MKKEKIDLREKLRGHKLEFDLLQEIPCTDKENEEYRKLLKDGGKLPEGVHPFDEDVVDEMTEFYTLHETDLTDAEIQEYLTYKQLSMIKTIKNCVLFFTVLTVLGILGYLFLLFNS